MDEQSHLQGTVRRSPLLEKTEPAIDRATGLAPAAQFPPSDGPSVEGPATSALDPSHFDASLGVMAGEHPLFDLPVASLRIVAEADRTVTLPRYAGSTLRGAFGHALKRLTCRHQLGGTVCEGCVENQVAVQNDEATRCVYGYLFDTHRPAHSPLLEHQREVPHPYVLRPVRGQGTSTTTDQPLIFEVQLCGYALDCVREVIAACVKLCRGGLGQGQGTSEVREVWECAPFVEARRLAPFTLDGGSLCLAGGWAQAVAAAANLPDNRLAAQFVTPTWLTRAGAPVDVPDFATLIRAVLRRLTLLGLFHGADVPEAHFRRLAKEAEGVRLVSWQGGWQDWYRYSSRQGRRMRFGGVIGRAVYAGSLGPFLPYLIYGQALHVGKACSFGGGWYYLSDPHDTTAPAPPFVL